MFLFELQEQEVICLVHFALKSKKSFNINIGTIISPKSYQSTFIAVILKQLLLLLLRLTIIIIIRIKQSLNVILLIMFKQALIFLLHFNNY